MARTNNPTVLFTDQDGSGDFQLPAAGAGVSLFNPFTVEVEWDGTLTGNAQVQTQIDGGPWVNEGSAIALGGAPGSGRVTVTDVVSNVRIDRNTAGGAGNMTARVLGLFA